MNTASLELCKELYDLSGWETGTFISSICPDYDLDYLLRKFPEKASIVKYSEELWNARDNGTPYGKWTVSLDGETPEDAACKLCIELFRQGILKRE